MAKKQKAKLQLATDKAVAALYKMMNVRQLVGFPLYEKVPKSNDIIIELTVKSNDKGALYLVDSAGHLVRSTGSIYDRLMVDNEFEEGETLVANVYLRQAIPDITSEELEENYGAASRNNNPAAIANYLAEAKGSYNHLYCDEIFDEE